MTTELDHSLARLYARQSHGIKLGLQATQELLAEIGNPQTAFSSVHVAGTNGKGSVCAMLESALRCAGNKTGLYTSPHLVRFHERIRVGGDAVPDAELEELIRVVEQADARCAARPGGRPATFFEFATVMAFEHFRRRKVTIAVVETGMGGRLDATNVLDPLVTIITSISLEHQQYLGDAIDQIATEKAGIIKPGRPVLCGTMQPEALDVIERVARERVSTVIRVGELVSIRRLQQDLRGQRLRIETPDEAYAPLALPLIGPHQRENCALAVAALESLIREGGSGLRLDSDAVRAGLESVSWPARCQLLQERPPVLLDAAHNPAGAESLARTLKEVWPERPIGLVAGFSSDKNAEGFFRALARRVDRCWGSAAAVERAMPVERVAAAARQAGVRIETDELWPVYQRALAWARDEEALVLVAGSLYLAGELLASLGMAPA